MFLQTTLCDVVWLKLRFQLIMLEKRNFYCILLLVIFLQTAHNSIRDSELNQNSQNKSSRSKHGRFLNLFSVIRFSNTPCSTKLGINGTCYTEKQCAGKIFNESLSAALILQKENPNYAYYNYNIEKFCGQVNSSTLFVLS